MKKIPKNKASAKGVKKCSKTKLVLAPLVDFGRPQVLKEPSHPSLVAFKRNTERPPTPYEDIRTRKPLRSPETYSSASSETGFYNMEGRQEKRSSKMPPLTIDTKHECDNNDDLTTARRQNGQGRGSFLPKIDGNSRNTLINQPPCNSKSSILKLPPADCRNVVTQGTYSMDGRPNSPPPGSLTNLEHPPTNGKCQRKRRTKSRMRHIHNNIDHDEGENSKKAKL